MSLGKVPMKVGGGAKQNYEPQAGRADILSNPERGNHHHALSH